MRVPSQVARCSNECSETLILTGTGLIYAAPLQQLPSPERMRSHRLQSSLPLCLNQDSPQLSPECAFSISQVACF